MGAVIAPVYTEPAAAGECTLTALANGRKLSLFAILRRGERLMGSNDGQQGKESPILHS
jgi:hypothetical protein